MSKDKEELTKEATPKMAVGNCGTCYWHKLNKQGGLCRQTKPGENAYIPADPGSCGRHKDRDEGVQESIDRKAKTAEREAAELKKGTLSERIRELEIELAIERERNKGKAKE